MSRFFESDDSLDDPDFCLNKKHRESNARLKRKRESLNLNRKKKSITTLPNLIKPIRPRLADSNGPLVKNFCVGLTLLDDEFVENALLGRCKWKEVFDQDDHFTKRNRSRMQLHSKYQPGYIFQSAEDVKSNDKNRSKNRSSDGNNQEDSDDADDENDELFDMMNDDPFASLNEDLYNESKKSYDIKQNGLQTASNTFKYQADHFLNSTRQSNNGSFVATSSLLNSESNKSSNGLSFDRSLSERSRGVMNQKCESIEFRSMNLDLKQDLNLSNLNIILNILKNLNTDNYEEIESTIPIKCLSCSYTTTSIRNLFLHSSYHRNICDICKATFKSVYEYFHHLGTHLQEAIFTCSSKLKLRCTNCLTFYENESHLIDHYNNCYTLLEQSTVFNEKIYKYRCKICNLVDVSFKSIQDHFIKQHMEVECSFCNYWFQNFEQLESHAHLNHKTFAHNNQCEYCMQKFTFKTIYENHLCNRHCIFHDENGVQRCYLCDHNFNEDDSDLIVEHLANHCDLFIYNCDTCEFRTNSKSDMISHTMKIVSSDQYVVLANRMDLNQLWSELTKQIQLAQEDFIIKDPLDEAIASIL